VPQCAPDNACGPDGCGGSCGSCSTIVRCQGDSVVTDECLAGICTPVATPCDGGQTCHINSCCEPSPPSSECRMFAESDGCGGFYPKNCAQVCCAGPDGGEVCKPASLCDDF
jgi:hypothetical protein